jgi:hypothetical protein
VTEEVAQKLTDDAAPLQALEKKMKDARSEVDKLTESAQPLLRVAAEREYWVKLLADLNKRLPKDFIWVTHLEVESPDAMKKEGEEPDNSGKPQKEKSKPKKGPERSGPVVRLVLKGLYLSRDAGNNAGPAVVDEFVKNLKESSFYTPDDRTEAGFVRENDDSPTVWAYHYQVPLNLTNPIHFQ